MNCSITNAEKKVIEASQGMNTADINSILKSVNSMSEAKRVSTKFTPDSILVRLLNMKAITYEGDVAKIVSITPNINTIPEDTTVKVEMIVNGKHVTKNLSREGYTGLNTSMEEVVSLKSDVDYVFDASTDYRTLALNAVNSPELIKGLVKDIELVDRDISVEEKTMLDKALNDIVIPLKDITPTISVLLNEKSNMSGGKIELTGKVGNVYLSSSRKDSQMSTYEAFVHELYHAVTSYMLSDPEASSVRKDIEDIRSTFMKSEEAQKVLKDSLPDQDNAQENLDKLLDYFVDPKVGLKEFIAYSATNKGMQDALRVISTKGKEETYPNFAAKFAGMVRKMFNMIVDKVRKKPKGDDLVQMAWLIDRLVQINQVQANVKKQSIITKLLRNLEKVDETAASMLDKQRKKAAKRPLKLGGSRLFQVMTLPMNIVRASYDENMRKYVGSVASFLGMSGTSTLPTLFRHAMESDRAADTAQMLGMKNQYYDTEREAIRKHLRLKIKSNFKRPIGTSEMLALNVLLDSDYDAIAGKYELSDLLDESKIAESIKNVRERLSSISTEKEMNYYTFQVDKLVDYMLNGKDHILLLKNAKNIALKTNKINSNLEENADAEALIDELTSLLALQKSGKNKKKLLKEIYKEETDKTEGLSGIEEMMTVVRGMNESAKRDSFREERGTSQMVKGYQVDVYDENIDMKVAPLADKEKLKREGYTLVMEVNNHKLDRSGAQGMYRSTLPIKQRIHKVGMRLKNTSARGSSFSSSHYRDGDDLARLKAETDVKMARNEMFKLVEQVENGTYKEKADDLVISPRFSEDGTVIDFNYNMDKALKKELMGADIDTFNIIGSTAASNYDKKITIEHNAEVVAEIVKEGSKNTKLWRGDKIIGKDSRVYNWIGPKSTDPKDKELWSIMPDAVKHVFRKKFDPKDKKLGTKKEPDGFYIREDLKNTLLGFREKSMVDFPVFRALPKNVKYVLQVAEEIIKAVVRIYKGQILLRIPEVLIMNIVSNFTSMIFYKVSPIKAAQYKLNAVKDLTDYIEMSKERVLLSYKIESGKASVGEKRRINEIDNRMEMSSVKDMMDAGFYNQIVEDIVDDKNGNIVTDYVGKKLENAPEIVKNAGRWVWLSDGNPVVKFMETTTQYSDFVARYALYNILTKEKGKSKEDATKIVRELYVNYTNPSSPMVEWANQMGAVMFTKYFTNIQKAIMALGKGHPVTFLLLMLGQNMVLDVPDITDSSFIAKDLTNLFYSPHEAFFSAAMPGSYIMADSLLR